MEILGSIVLWPYIQSVIDMDTVSGVGYNCYIVEMSSVGIKFNLIFKDGITCLLVLLLCQPGMYWVWVSVE
jgi:hypothetical protein